MDNVTREQLADYAHNTWSGWMKYLFSKCYNEVKRNSDNNPIPTGNVVIPKWAVERWKQQMNTEYKSLPESEKKSDRKEADMIIKIVED